MKNLLSIALALIGILSASSQDFLTKFTTSKTGNISIYFKAAEPNTTVSITVNDGEPTTANIAKANYSTAIKVALPSQESNTVTVSAKGITLFNYGNGKMSNIEFGSQASTINEVRVNNNNLSSLSFVDQLPALTYLVAGGNPDITSVAINLPNLQKLELDNSPSVTSLTLNTPELNLLKLNKSKITSLDLSGTKMADLTLAGDSLLKTVNFGNITTLKNVSITSNPAIESLSFKNMPELLKVILTGCPALSDVTLENLPQMWQFNAPDANLSSIDFVNCPFPKGDITLSGNNFETFAPNTPGVWTMTINNFKAKTVDLSALPLLNTLKATGGDIEKIIFHKESLDSAMKNLDVKNNNFTLINLPPRGKNVNTALNYYAPQKVMPTIPDVITVNTPVDLSAWGFGQSLDGNVASQIVWETSLEEILQEGVDYTVENGVYTFLKAREEQVRAIISNTAFPDFKITKSGNNTYDYRLITNYATLEDEPEPEFLTKFTTSKTGNISIYFKAAEPNTTVSITVNDGEPTTANIAKANYSTAIKVALPSQESNTVTVSAKGITLFNYGNGKMSNIEFGSQASTINEVRVNNNNLSSLSFVDQLPALTYLVAGGNPDITSVAINLPNLQKLELDNSPSVTSLTLNTPELNLLKLNKSKITSLDLSGTKMADLTLAGDSLLKTVNFGNITTLKNVSITSNPAIESLSFKNMPELLKVILTGCPALSDVTLENLPQMWQFNAPDANLSSIDFVNCPFPKGDITLSGNNFETFAPNTPGVWTMTINNFKAKTVDLSALPLLNTLKATGGDIEKIIFHKESLDSAMKNLDVKNNNFTLINLPPRGKNVNTALNYYAPQKVMPTIPDVITVNTPVDLSAWGFGQSLDGNVASQIVWETSLEEILQEGVDYTVENGVYTFLKAREEQVRAIISNTAFPDFKITKSGNNTYDYRLITNYATLEDEPEPEFLTKFTTSKTGNISIYFKAAEPNTTVSITVNDGEPTTANIAKANYSTAIKVALPSQESNTVTVSAKGITLFNYGNGKMSNIEFGSQASTINEVRVNNNNLSSLSFVDQLPALTYLVAGGNPDITSVAINLPNLQKLELDNSPSVTSLTLNTPELNLLKLNKSKITSLDLSGTKMADLTLAGDSLLKTVNFGNITTLKNVSITSNPAIESLSFKNMPELLKVILTGCPALSDVTLENLPQMWQFNAPDANLSSIDFVNCPFPKGDITLSGNNFETFAPNTPGVWTMTINNFKAKTVDLSALPLLNTLKATGGDIEKIIFHKESLDSAMKNLDVKNNNFTLINLPPRGKNVNTALNYYAPQKVMPTIPDVITVNTPVDLSAWGFGQSLDGNVASQIVWETSLEEILQEGVDYTVENGVYTFLKAREEQVRAIISNTAFPDFKITKSGNNTYDYRLITNYATLEDDNVGIENVITDSNLNVTVSGSTLCITSDSNVEVYNIEGQLIYQGVATAISLNKGVYIIRNGANVAKIII